MLEHTFGLLFVKVVSTPNKSMNWLWESANLTALVWDYWIGKGFFSPPDCTVFNVYVSGMCSINSG